MVLDGAWPIGFPCRVHTSWGSRAGELKKPFSATAGAEGFVIRETANGAWYHVSLHEGTGFIDGFLPKSCVTVAPATGPKYGDTSFVDRTPALAFEIEAQDFDTSLGKTIRAMVQSYEANSDLIDDVSTTWIEHKGGFGGTEGIIALIIKGMQDAGQYDVCNNPDFTAADMEAAGRNHSQSRRACIYIRIYHMPDGSIHIYIGQTIDFLNRQILSGSTSHEAVHQTAVSTVPHYVLTRGFTRCEAFPICYLDSEIVRDVAEQLFINMFEGYHDAVLKFTDPSLAVTTNNILTQNDFVAQFTVETVAARQHTLFAKKIFAVTDWQGTKRASFGGLNGASSGCNWMSPLNGTSNTKRQVWTRMVVITPRGRMAVYRRHPYKANVKGKYTCIYVKSVSHSGNVQSSIDFYIPHWDKHSGSTTIAGPRDGELGSPIFELMLEEGAEHEHPLWVVPGKVGRYSNHMDNLRLALKYEWTLPDGTTAYRYMQYTPQKDSVPGSLGTSVAWMKASGWIAYFEQKVFRSAPSWMWKFGIANLKEITFDHLSQTYFLDNVAPPDNIEKDFPIKYTNAQLKVKLEAAGLTPINNHFGAIPADPIKPGRRRSKCDHCYIDYLVDKARGKSDGGFCKLHSNFTCVACMHQGRICSWTRTALIIDVPANQARREAVYYYPAKSHDEATVDDSEVVTGTVDRIENA